jgi:glutamate:Na+ symporter, ESS family
MQFWQTGTATTLMAVLSLLLIGSLIREVLPFLRSFAIPSSIIAGLFGLVVGPGALGIIPMDQQVLESMVYHGLAIVFIAIALQSPPKGQRSAGVVSFALGVPLIIAMQLLIGLVLVIVWAPEAHPGLGLMLALGFEQGPGQALSLGTAWESNGMENGGQIGLIFAAIGFFWSIVCGVPLVIWGKRRGLISTAAHAESGATKENETSFAEAPGSLEPLTKQMVAIGVVYLATYGFVGFLANVVFASMPNLSSMSWGFHFIFGALFAMAARPLVHRVNPQWLNDRQLGSGSSMVVDLITCAALSAVQLQVLWDNLAMILLITSVGGLLTLVTTLWLARRAFPEAPFEHCLVWFGLSTGTLPMGLALLRIVDPDLRSPASMSAVLGSGAALAGGAPLMMGIIPMVVGAWPDAYPGQGVIAAALLTAYIALLLVIWVVAGPLKIRFRPLEIWPAEDPYA